MEEVNAAGFGISEPQKYGLMFMGSHQGRAKGGQTGRTHIL